MDIHSILEKYDAMHLEGSFEYAKSHCSRANQWRSNLEQSREFYETVGKEMIHTNFPEWGNRIAAATNGVVFRDDMGVFSNIRKKLLAYYPEKVWRGKVAQSIHEFSQYAQSNYARMMARGDTLTAKLCVSKAIESTMDLIYLLNRTYAPYYKWKKKGLEQFPVSKKILPLLEKLAELPNQSDAWNNATYDASVINKVDKCVDLFEQIAKELLGELKRQDLVDAEQKGWNLIMEKYARMMKSTNPEKYVALEKDLPVITEERSTIQEEIIKIQVAWMEEFAEMYPKMAGNARSIRTVTDTAFNTSYETYLRGEMSTYSESTFVLYSRFIVLLLKQNRNLAKEIMENTAKLYGYDSLQAVEIT